MAEVQVVRAVGSHEAPRDLERKKHLAQKDQAPVAVEDPEGVGRVALSQLHGES
jgi:hypothetical protein